MATAVGERARRLRNAVEPVAAGVYSTPEAHAAYAGAIAMLHRVRREEPEDLTGVVRPWSH